jgi:hypothetical protein
MSARLLPESFGDLEQFAARWALPTENDRHARRLASTMTELQSFYDAMLPRIDAILAYLNDFPLESLQDEARTLLNLSLSLAEIAPAVELFGQVEVPDAYDSRRITAVEH